MTKRILPTLAIGGVLVSLVACSATTATSSTGSPDPSAATVPAGTGTSAPGTDAAPTSAPGPTGTATTATASTATASAAAIVNVWRGKPIDLTKLPLGTSKVSLTTPAVGGLFSCEPARPNGAGAAGAGPWINEAAGTWDATKKPAVQGSNSWPMAKYDEQVSGDQRIITANGLPVGYQTGNFPIAQDDPVHVYDGNPNKISEHDFTLTLPLNPKPAAQPQCLPKSGVGVFKNGVALLNALDEPNRDAVAYEVQDVCDGHPQQQGVYHYHNLPSCLLNAAKGSSTVVGFAADGYPIVVERDAAGNLPTNADLDECHGRTSTIVLDGKTVESYHYSATHEFPYTLGCFKGTPVQTPRR